MPGRLATEVETGEAKGLMREGPPLYGSDGGACSDGDAGSDGETDGGSSGSCSSSDDASLAPLELDDDRSVPPAADGSGYT